VSAVIARLIAVGGILLGVTSTYWLQLRAVERAGAAERQKRLRQDQFAACSEFAVAVTDLQRALIVVWFRQRRRNRAVTARARPPLSTTRRRLAALAADWGWTPASGGKITWAEIRP
jgi:hypothetical protein